VTRKPGRKKKRTADEVLASREDLDRDIARMEEQVGGPTRLGLGPDGLERAIAAGRPLRREMETALHVLKLVREGYDAREYIGVRPRRPGPLPSFNARSWALTRIFYAMRALSPFEKQESIRRRMCEHFNVADSTLRGMIQENRDRYLAEHDQIGQEGIESAPTEKERKRSALLHRMCTRLLGKMGEEDVRRFLQDGQEWRLLGISGDS
jgi:hypothetical protein